MNAKKYTSKNLVDSSAFALVIRVINKNTKQRTDSKITVEC